MMTMKLAGNYPIKQGGLWRCCIQTIMDTVFESPPEEGHKIECKQCRGWIQLHESFWQWAPDDSLMSVPATP